MDLLTLNYAAYDDALKLALAGQSPGTEVTLTLTVKVAANTDESVDLNIESVSIDPESIEAPDAEAAEESAGADDEGGEGKGMMGDEPAVVVAMSKKGK